MTWRESIKFGWKLCYCIQHLTVCWNQFFPTAYFLSIRGCYCTRAKIHNRIFLFVSHCVCGILMMQHKWNKNGEICTNKNGKIALKWKQWNICGEKESDNYNIWRILIESVIIEIWKRKNNQQTHHQWNSSVHLLDTDDLHCVNMVTVNGSMHIYVYIHISLSLARLPLSTMQWSYIFYIREKKAQIFCIIFWVYIARF